MKTAKVLFITVWLTLGAGLVWAHHSYVMFDRTKILTVEGSIAKFEWQNPHVWIWAYVKNDKGGFDIYGFETSSVTGLSQRGWRKDTLKPGDKLTIQYHRLKSGENGGYFVQGNRPDGSILVGDQAAIEQLRGEKEPPPLPVPNPKPPLPVPNPKP